ncbi:hypothetical protein MDA_GLEAN10023560 [Myotis davidii]|uniref:Uncharacterized protein n=1 Tax=Myotis davidii TaxID=225400 RepID=L5M215_MYODS|nr:hypothetical protein MDA_GLEAN10023560 [Myotis davidii]
MGQRVCTQTCLLPATWEPCLLTRCARACAHPVATTGARAFIQEAVLSAPNLSALERPVTAVKEEKSPPSGTTWQGGWEKGPGQSREPPGMAGAPFFPPKAVPPASP